MILYDVYNVLRELQLPLHPVAVVECTFTHQHYTEKHNGTN
jgi:hypothetical protein